MRRLLLNQSQRQLHGCSSPTYSSVLLADNFKITGKVGALSAKPMGEAADGMAECKAGAQLL